MTEFQIEQNGWLSQDEPRYRLRPVDKSLCDGDGGLTFSVAYEAVNAINRYAALRESHAELKEALAFLVAVHAESRGDCLRDGLEMAHAALRRAVQA